MLEPELSLAFTIHSGKGTHALLLASGVSRSAGIPTGWEVVCDLARKLAAAQGKECGANPEQWYLEAHGDELNYSRIIGELAKTQAERQELLRSYFEPTDEERASGLKAPQEAHRAIASLVQGGFVRVIVTTNFDHLIERTLEPVA